MIIYVSYFRLIDNWIVMSSTGLLFLVHLSYICMGDVKVGELPKAISIIPIAFFGIAHALFVTL